VVASQVAVAFVLSAVSSVILLIAAYLAYDFEPANTQAGVVGVFIILVLGFSAFGILLGAVLPTARSAQAIGMLIWFVMLFLGGAGPPPEVLTDSMRTIAEFTPLWHAVQIMQEPWLGLDAGLSWLVFIAVGAVSVILSLRFFRWE
jgi:ABC-2 type transport system permease protein